MITAGQLDEWREMAHDWARLRGGVYEPSEIIVRLIDEVRRLRLELEDLDEENRWLAGQAGLDADDDG